AASNYDKSLPENLINNVPGLPDTRLVKAAALYGPNAGGKSNVLLALRFLRWLVVESATGQKPEAKLPAEPFRLDKESRKAPTTLELTFIAKNTRYELAIAVTIDRIVQERLVAYPQGRAQVWYDRVWNEEAKQYDWSLETTHFHRDPGIVEKTRPNTLFLSTAAVWNNTQVAPVYQWFSRKLAFMNLSPDGAQLSHDFTAEMVQSSGEWRKVITGLLRSADLGLTDVEATVQTDAEVEKFFNTILNQLRDAGASSDEFAGKVWQITFQHAGKGGGDFPIHWADESAGTRRFFSVLGPWLTAINEGQVLCVDELETSLHPSLAAELLRLLFKRKDTELRPQLLFTTHNPLLLDMTLLRRDQIWFADKNQEGESFLYPLTDYKPRADESLVRGYLSGRYGAVPFIPRGLIDGDSHNPNAKEAVNAS
ncbi:MAG TPA: ATP-binding protein, partial [Clostridia bacterium]|nr:ATP-binding protein [Clostridia bacterium]